MGKEEAWEGGEETTWLAFSGSLILCRKDSVDVSEPERCACREEDVGRRSPLFLSGSEA